MNNNSSATVGGTEDSSHDGFNVMKVESITSSDVGDADFCGSLFDANVQSLETIDSLDMMLSSLLDDHANGGEDVQSPLTNEDSWCFDLELGVV